MFSLGVVPSIGPRDFSFLLDGRELKILDVREIEEINLSSLPSVLHIPMGEVESQLAEIREFQGSQEVPLYVVCRSGGRSAMVVEYLIANNFTNVHNLDEGLNGLSKYFSAIKPY